MKATFKSSTALTLLLAAVFIGCLALAFRGSGKPASSAGDSTTDAQQLVSILQYLESDYPAAVASKDEAELAEQRSLSAEAVATAARVPALSRLATRVASIDERVRRADDPAGVSSDCVALVDDVAAVAGIVRAPSTPPLLDEGAQLFASTCSTCHGSTGDGNGPAAAALTPKPASFQSAEVMRALTPYKAFNAIRFGVKGTAMAPFTGYDDKQRWALAFYLFTLRAPPCEHPASTPRISLDVLANRTDGDLASLTSSGDVACLRRNLPVLDAPSLVAAAHAQVESAARLADNGDPRAAESAVLDAYLNDIEPIEPWLRAHDPDTVTQLEASFTATRAALQTRDPRAAAETTKLLSLLDRAGGGGARRAATAPSVFWLSALVIVREGFEAAVIIAALLAVLKKRRQVARARFVHAGWLSALGVGAIVFVVGRRILAGAMNERVEGILAFVAAAMLLHAALWLNAKTTTRKTMGALRDQTDGALDRGAFALFGIAFLAMFRESFETAVFLEALSIDAPRAVVWGAGAGAVVLSGLVFAVSRLGLRLPMQTLFKASTVVLVATAVVLLGEGVHSFEEIGLLPSRPIPFIAIPLLGIYPDAVGVIVQLVVGLAPLAWRAWRGRAPPVEAPAAGE